MQVSVGPLGDCSAGVHSRSVVLSRERVVRNESKAMVRSGSVSNTRSEGLGLPTEMTVLRCLGSNF